MAVGALEPQFYDEFLEKLGLSEDEMPQFGDFERSREKLTNIFKRKTQAEWSSTFDGSDACVTPILSFEDVASHKHNSYQKSFSMGKDDLVVPNPAPRLSRTPGVSCSTQVPNLNSGEHTLEILNELKFTKEEINDFVNENIVTQYQNNSKL